MLSLLSFTILFAYIVNSLLSLSYSSSIAFIFAALSWSVLPFISEYCLPRSLILDMYELYFPIYPPSLVFSAEPLDVHPVRSTSTGVPSQKNIVPLFCAITINKVFAAFVPEKPNLPSFTSTLSTSFLASLFIRYTVFTSAGAVPVILNSTSCALIVAAHKAIRAIDKCLFICMFLYNCLLSKDKY